VWDPNTNELRQACLSGMYGGEMLLRYADELYERYDDIPVLSYTHILSNHQVCVVTTCDQTINRGCAEYDEYLAEHYLRRREETVFLFVADHGLIYGDYYYDHEVCGWTSGLGWASR
jgi:hypothetical protein